MKKIVAGVVALVMLAGCGGGVQKDATYAAATDLRDAMVESGYECPGWSDKDTGAGFDAGSCLTDGRDQVRVYPSIQAREGDQERAIFGCQLSIAVGRVEKSMLTGANWSICGPAGEVPKLQPKLGGFVPDISDVRVP